MKAKLWMFGIKIVAIVFLALALGTSAKSFALQPGGGGGGGTACHSCYCSIGGSVGGQGCGCPTGGGGSGCAISGNFKTGFSCVTLYGPCTPSVGGFAP